MAPRRVGLIVPSSNVTVETELPALLSAQPGLDVTFHSSRMRMTSVASRGLAAMNFQRERCVMEIADAAPHVVLYTCLVALMAGEPREHHRVESLVAEQLATGQSPTLVRSRAGVLLEALGPLAAVRIALVTPYVEPLAQSVVDYLEHESVGVVDHRALGVEDNHVVGCIPGERVMAAARALDLAGADAVVICACVQMPSLALIADAEQELGLPVLSAATAGAFSILRALNVPADIPGAGALLPAGSTTSTTSTPGATR